MSRKQILTMATLLGLVAGQNAWADSFPAAPRTNTTTAPAKPMYVGMWKARFSNGYRILKLNADGTFKFLSLSKGDSTVSVGRYRVENGRLKYDVPNSKWGDASISFLGNDLMHLRTIDKDGKLSSGVAYQRQQMTPAAPLSLTGTWKAKVQDSTVILQLDSDGTFKIIGLLPKGQSVHSGRWETRGRQLILKTDKTTETINVDRIAAGAIHVRTVNAKDNNPGLFLLKATT